MLLRNVAQIHPSPMHVAVESVRDLMREALPAPDNDDWNHGAVIELRFSAGIKGGPFVSFFTNAPANVAARVASHNLPLMQFIADHEIIVKVVSQSNRTIASVKHTFEPVPTMNEMLAELQQRDIAEGY